LPEPDAEADKAMEAKASGDPKPEPLDFLAERIEKAGVTRTGFVSVAADLGILPEEQEWSFLMAEEVEAMLARFDEIVAMEKEGRTE
jgi:DNA-binding ferritin-like protein